MSQDAYGEFRQTDRALEEALAAASRQYRKTLLVLADGVDAITERPYRWTIYLAGLHRPDNADPYMKSEELALDGIYRAESLIDVIEPRSIELKARCNPNHLIGMAWIAIPYQATLTTAEASRIFDAFGAWRAKEAA